jgi:16S rRNA C967 or C1407 C5-methylase (RsmB/RsmF family)
MPIIATAASDRSSPNCRAERRKRRRDDGSRDTDKNPLSSARKGSGGNANGRGRADRDARRLWHRKSDAGYHLFLSFYGSQPAGVVAREDEDDDGPAGDGGKEDDAANNANDVVGTEDASTSNGVDRSGGGMSRASKRRRRKEGGSSGQSGRRAAPPERRAAASEVAESPSKRYRTACPPSSADPSRWHPLLRAFAAVGGGRRLARHLGRFVRALSRPLPLTLRFRECGGGGRSPPSAADDVRRRLREDHRDLLSPAPFDPTGSIYQSTPGSSLCRSNLGDVSPKLKEIVAGGSSSGILARQELGSMLPVLCLRAVGAMGVGSKVLDLCASPGSKTLQALEIVAARFSAADGCDRGEGGGGRVIANDVHPGRLDALREAVLRSGVPGGMTSRVTYTNYDASAFPPPRSGRLFDAVICDVPCGGDGTIRKDAHVLPTWTPNVSNSMHGLQLRILLRALELAKVGGVVCYSTCSMNPIEDEAVVAAALGRKGAVGGATYKILDWPTGLLPGFVRRPGVSDWRVACYDQDGERSDDDDDGDFGGLLFFDCYESALAAGVGGEVSPSFWPNAAENGNLGLHRCTRLFPQDQDSGGFFLGLIKRLS